jgi:signal peptidase I
MNFNFELILFYAVVITGVIALFDVIFLEKKRKQMYQEKSKKFTDLPELKPPLLIEYARSFFPILILVFLLRSFLYEPFRIPSSSLEPTMLIGDFLLVNKFDYGLRLPVAHKLLYKIHEPQRGDIFVFRFPKNPSVDFIKRVIGLPGDRISYINKVLSINGKEIPQTMIKTTSRVDENGESIDVYLKNEDLFGVKHDIYQNVGSNSEDFHDVVVPPGMYFAMGDNRDDSDDSRFWGFVPDANIVGKAVVILGSYNSARHLPRTDRFFKKIQ